MMEILSHLNKCLATPETSCDLYQELWQIEGSLTIKRSLHCRIFQAGAAEGKAEKHTAQSPQQISIGFEFDEWYGAVVVVATAVVSHIV